jgi:hypothetical protein
MAPVLATAALTAENQADVQHVTCVLTQEPLLCRWMTHLFCTGASCGPVMPCHCPAKPGTECHRTGTRLASPAPQPELTDQAHGPGWPCTRQKASQGHSHKGAEVGADRAWSWMPPMLHMQPTYPLGSRPSISHLSFSSIAISSASSGLFVHSKIWTDDSHGTLFTRRSQRGAPPQNAQHPLIGHCHPNEAL